MAPSAPALDVTVYWRGDPLAFRRVEEGRSASVGVVEGTLAPIPWAEGAGFVFARVRIPYRPPAEYRLTAVVERQAGSNALTVGLLMGDVERLGERVERLKTHFGQTEKDLREIDISADRITKRGQRILDVDLGEEPELPKPREESLPFAEKGRK